MAGSAPSGEIDPRKEVNKMRMSLTGGSLTKNRTSPFGTPKGMKSPLLSPLINDPQKLAALNLEPGVTKVCVCGGGAAEWGCHVGEGREGAMLQSLVCRTSTKHVLTH
eukprot:GHUV01019393.1.p1 GENE.GHUV01019393.1~~GHUV01019393.1.p1  ORF type:complete len:108 (+),score=13.84 GHUV01019393.1:334-657(+)